MLHDSSQLELPNDGESITVFSFIADRYPR